MHKEHVHDRPHRHHYDADMLDVEEALERIMTFFVPLPAVDVPLLEALGQVLAVPLVAPPSQSTVVTISRPSNLINGDVRVTSDT